MSEVLRVFLENERAIKRYLKRFCSRAQDIEDFAQESFLRTFAAEMKQEIREPKAYLFQVARNLALGDLRRKKRSPDLETGDSGGMELFLDEGQATTEDWMEGRRKLAFFARAVAELPPKCRKAFMLCRVHGLQYKQIANRMGISVSAVEKHVALGLLRCSAYLREHGYDPSEIGGIKSEKPKRGENAPARVAIRDDQNRE